MPKKRERPFEKLRASAKLSAHLRCCMLRMLGSHISYPHARAAHLDSFKVMRYAYLNTSRRITFQVTSCASRDSGNPALSIQSSSEGHPTKQRARQTKHPRFPSLARHVSVAPARREVIAYVAISRPKRLPDLPLGNSIAHAHDRNPSSTHLWLLLVLTTRDSNLPAQVRG
jgi:hypothetical protein